MENILMFQPRKEQMFTLLNVLIFKNKKKIWSITWVQNFIVEHLELKVVS